MDQQIPCVQDPRFRSDRIFNQINKHFITLRDDDMKIYSAHLQRVVEAFKDHMKRVDPLFNAFFSRIAYVGSYYENLKVGKPEEFDLDFVIKLPVNYESSFTHIVAPETSGYIKIKVAPTALDILQKNPMWNEGKRMKKWFNSNNYLDQNAFREWFESVVHKAFSSANSSTSTADNCILNVGGVQYKLSMRKSGPAFTLLIEVPGINAKIDVDLVPVLEFDTPLPKPFRKITVEKKKWFAVSKPLNGVQNGTLLWRPGFYEQEQCTLKGPIKQVIRQMKKFRDTREFHSIASYYIKTLFLWELDRQNSISPQEKTWNGDFQKMSSTYLFFYMLHKLRDACKKGELNDYWNSTNNLFSRIGTIEINNFYGRIKRIIEVIDKRIASDEFVIASFILEEDEFERLKNLTDTNGRANNNSPSIEAPAQSFQPESKSTSSLKTASAESSNSSSWQMLATTGGLLATAGILVYRYWKNSSQRKSQ